jgi:SAM-dependent methyltransferase
VRSSEQDLALGANVFAKVRRAEEQQVAGSPHLRHSSIQRRFGSLVDQAIAATGLAANRLAVLDIGAGDGLASLPWLRRGVRLTAVDCSAATLQRLAQRAAAEGATARTIEADAGDFFAANREHFNIISFTSMLHHVPDYVGLLEQALASVETGGCLLSFQDPLRYDTMKRGHHRATDLAYLAWRLGQGDLIRGARARLRRRRGRYLVSEVTDFEEYHVVRNGVDSDLIIDALRPRFERVERSIYWATQVPILQRLGERLGLTSHFAIAALGRV